MLAELSRPIGAGATALSYYHTDALGSPIAKTNASGTVIERTKHEPYGLADRPNDDRVGYTGHVMDSASGLTYMQQRYYDPGIGRFLSVDPVTADGNTGGNFNRYNYANNNPYRFIDPDGRRGREAADHAREQARARREPPPTGTRFRTRSESGRQSSGGSHLASTPGQLARNVGNAVVNATNMTLYGEVSGAAGKGGTLSYSDNLKTGEQKAELVGAIGKGVGIFAGVEVDILTFSIPGAKDAPVFFDSADVKVGDVIAGGLKLQLNPGRTATLKGFGGLGFGGKGVINKPLSIGTTLWSNKDD